MDKDRSTVAVDGGLLDDLQHLGGLGATDPAGIVQEALDTLRAAAVSANNVRFWLGLPGSASDGAVKAEISALIEAGAADPARRLVYDAVAEGRISPSAAAFWRAHSRTDLAASRAALAAMPAGVWTEADSDVEAGLPDQNTPEHEPDQVA